MGSATADARSRLNALMRCGVKSAFFEHRPPPAELLAAFRRAIATLNSSTVCESDRFVSVPANRTFNS